MTPWWDQTTAIWIGVLGGGGGGTACGLLGAMTGFLVPRGIGRRVMVPAFGAIAAGGAVALVAGIVAVATGQPYHVYYPLLLGGGIVAVVMGSLLPVMIAGYRRADARRMHAQELRRG